MRVWKIKPQANTSFLAHHGRKGQKWGVKNGPPYPLDDESKSQTEKEAEELIDRPMKYARMRKKDSIVLDAVKTGKVSLNVHQYNQNKHVVGTKEFDSSRSYIYGDSNDAKQYIDELYGTGQPIIVKGEWRHKERVKSPYPIGVYKDINGVETETCYAMIVYGKSGTHIYPRQKGDDG